MIYSQVVQFDDDQLDESDELYSVLRDSVARRQAEGEVRRPCENHNV